MIEVGVAVADQASGPSAMEQRIDCEISWTQPRRTAMNCATHANLPDFRATCPFLWRARPRHPTRHARHSGAIAQRLCLSRTWRGGRRESNRNGPEVRPHSYITKL